MRHFSAVLVASVVAVACTGPAIADHGGLSGDAIRSAVAGARASGNTPSGQGYQVRYLEDGTTRFSRDDNSFIDRGTWAIEGDRFCGRWEKIRNGAKGCWQLIHLQGDKYLFKGVDGAADIESVLTK